MTGTLHVRLTHFGRIASRTLSFRNDVDRTGNFSPAAVVPRYFPGSHESNLKPVGGVRADHSGWESLGHLVKKEDHRCPEEFVYYGFSLMT